jgi:glyoxylase-like metal-dependent hydrolase (beta-lactamase superfamily II)
MMTGPGTNTYVVGDDSLAVVDPGPDDGRHLAALLDVVEDRLEWIVVTHTHSDHSPLTERLKAATGARVAGFGPPVRRVGGLDGNDRTFVADRLLRDGDVVVAGGRTLQAVHTPGHASNHLCYLLDDSGLLFSGDHVMNGSTVVIGPPDGDMTAYLEALARVRSLQPARIAPGHGEVIEDPLAVLDGYVAHRHEREAKVVAALRHQAGGEGRSAEELVPEVYQDVPVELHPYARYSLWAHLRRLGTLGAARSPDPDDPEAPWWPGTDVAEPSRPD